MFHTIIPITARHRSLSDDMLNRHIQYLPGMLNSFAYSFSETGCETNVSQPVVEQEEIEITIHSLVDKDVQTDQKPVKSYKSIVQGMLGCLVIIGGVIGCNELEYALGGILLCISIHERWNVKK